MIVMCELLNKNKGRLSRRPRLRAAWLKLASRHLAEWLEAAVLSLVFASNVNGGERSSDSDALR